MSNNMLIWSQTCETDPQYTKSVPKGKGFSITAIDAQSQIMKATELFGPFGHGWGVSSEKFDFLQLNGEKLFPSRSIF